MATKNGVTYRQWLVDSSKYDIKASYPMTPKKITIHNTDNQMPAENEISYMRGNNNYTSYHIAVDETEAIQGVPFNRNAWHSGDGNNGYGNRNTIGVEICRNYDRARSTTVLNQPLAGQYAKAEANAIKVVAAVMYENNIAPTLDNVKFHYEWSGKWCPSKILSERRGTAFKAALIAEAIKYKASKEGKSTTATTSSKTTTTTSSSATAVTTTGKTIVTLVAETLAGKYGTGATRKSKLGSNYDVVQALINAKYGTATASDIDVLADATLDGDFGSGDTRKNALGSVYDRVQAAVNKKLGSSTTTTAKKTTTTTKLTIEQLVTKTMAGEYGSGDTRKAKLGSNYNLVQAIINGRAGVASAADIKVLADATLNNVFGSGDTRKTKLGAAYDKVQAEINRRLA